LLAAVEANGGALRELRVGARADTAQTLDSQCVQRLLEAAPQLTACHADVLGGSSVASARRMLNNEPPFQLLHLHAVCVDFEDADEREFETSVFALAVDVATSASLQRVVLCNAPLQAVDALDAVVEAALARGLASVRFVSCGLRPAGVPALARLLASGTLASLAIHQDDLLLDRPSAALLGAALRANTTLTSFSLRGAAVWRLWIHDAATAAVLGALTGHCSVRAIQFSVDNVLAVGPAALGAALGALVAANAPALTELDVSSSYLGDEGLGPLLAALPGNTHLRELNVALNAVGDAFARDVLLPAVRANASLRRFTARLQARWAAENAFTREAEALAAAR
jgi:hypothetical protein